MTLAVLSIVCGLVLLVVGAESLVRGANGLALLARVSPTVIGLTIVAAGTSMPELLVSVDAALRDSPGLSLGNVVGSNIFNLAAIVGCVALIRPLRIQGNTVRLEWPVMMLASSVLHLLCRDGTIDRLEGGFLLGGMVAFMAYAVWVARRNATPLEHEEFRDMAATSFDSNRPKAWLFNTGGVLLGVGLLSGGASVLVDGAVTLATMSGVSPTVIGLTVVAAGTSLPELATSVTAALRGKDDIAIANLIGSNIFNVLGIVGTTALILPLPVPEEIIVRDNWWMLGVSALLFPLMRSNMRVTRPEGALLLACFLVYMLVLLMAL
ncbi:MAG: calcium/sodium antiporter [Polyangiales bacterium]